RRVVAARGDPTRGGALAGARAVPGRRDRGAAQAAADGPAGQRARGGARHRLPGVAAGGVDDRDSARGGRWDDRRAGAVMRAEQVTAVCTVHGEGAVWSDAWGGLRFVDMLAGDVLALTVGGEVRRRDVGAVAACVRPRTGGGMVVALQRGFALFDEADQLQWGTEVWDVPDIRMNEGSCDPDGRFWCG